MHVQLLAHTPDPALAGEMYKSVYAVALTLFRHSAPACVYGLCTERKMTCRKAAKVRARYQALQESCLDKE